MTTYSYDRENRLISQNVDGNVTSFAYDGFGRKRRESRGVNPDVILNWDGDQMIVESSDLDPEAPSKTYYVADGVIYAENANLGSRKSRRDYAVDFLGSVTGLTDIDSGISSVRRWSAYGKLLSGSSEPIGYFWTGNTGSRVYQSLGLNDNRARNYGRNIKQWITRDPLWPSELPYTYVGGNPVTRIDPSGQQQFTLPLPPEPKIPMSGDISGPCPDCSKKPFDDDTNGRPKLPIGEDYVKNCCCALKNRSRMLGTYWFYKMVRNKARWDFKQSHGCFERAGNYHFGFMAMCNGIPLLTALIGAGAAQIKAGTSDPKWKNTCKVYFVYFPCKSPFGDDPRDQKQITAGYEDALKNFKEIKRKCSFDAYKNPCPSKPVGPPDW